MISRRGLIKGLAASTLLPGAALRAQTRVITTPIAVEEDRVWIAASIGGSRPVQFIIDTGAVVSLISEGLAREFGLRERGRFRLIGAGGPEDFLVYEGRDVAFSGGTVQRSVVFGAMPPDLILGRDAAGVLAAGLLTQSDSDLDFGRGEWRLYPDGRGAREGYRELPSSIRHVGNGNGSPYMLVDASLDGNVYRFLLDTGAPGQVRLWPRAVRRSGLWNDAGPYAPGRAFGIGGAGARGRTVRAGTLRIGDFAFERPLVSLNEPSSRHEADFADGIIGLGYLELLNLSTDVRRHRLWAQPSGRPQRPERYRLTGLWVEQSGDALEITDLSPRSPAADAGLQRGDEISGLSMAEFSHQSGGRAGDSIALSYRRGGETRTTRITLREFL
jgi:serine protease Do